MNRRRFFKWLGLGSFGLFAGGGLFAAYKPGNPYYSGPKSDHFDGTSFFNPEGMPPGRFVDLLKWQLSGEQAKWPASFTSPFADEKPAERVKGRKLKITMVGHATLLIQTQGLNFLTDPVFANRASPFRFAGPKRVNPPGVHYKNLPPIDYVLLTHNHYDHLDLETLGKLVRDHDPLVITPLGNDSIVKKQHEKARCFAGDWGDVAGLAEDVLVHFEPCHHWSARGMKDRRMALWAAFVIETPNGKIYHVGDTGYHSGINYRAVYKKHGTLRAAILPVGAYEPRWFMKGQHQNPDEAVQGHLLCRAEVSIGHHWGTFQLTDEAIEAPVEALETACRKHGLLPDTFIALQPGQFWESQGTAQPLHLMQKRTI